MNKRLHTDPAEIKSLTGSPLMTTLVSLIYMCLQRLTTFVSPAFGTNQPPALVQWAQAAIFFVAPTRLTPARSIHAPTPRPRRWPIHFGRPRAVKSSPAIPPRSHCVPPASLAHFGHVI